MQKIDYYFDFLSPFSYFSWILTRKLRTNPDYQFHLKPVVMGTLFNHWGIKGPGEIAPKRLQMLKQCFQFAAVNQIDFTPPKSHPFNPLYSLRLATFSCAGEVQNAVIEALWQACWAQGVNIGEPDIVKIILNKAMLNGEALLEKTFTKEVKQELKNNTQEAIDRGVFGVPSFFHNDELYWGIDNIEFLKLSLKGELPEWNKELFLERTQDIKLFE
jgi:2-hydroxychromene-2-carboxylate isomerase